MSNVEIYFNGRDNLSKALQTMRDNSNRAKKDLSQLSQELADLNNKKVNAKFDLKQAQEALKNTKKDAQSLGVSFDELFKERQAAVIEFENSLKSVNNQIKENERATRSLTSVQAGSNTSSSEISQAQTQQGTISQLAQAGLFKQLGDSVVNATQVGVSSLLGTSDGAAFSSIASGALAGATLGSIVPGIGTAVGAAVGTVAGVINAGVQKFQENDDAFKNVVQENFETVQSLQQETLTSSSSIAGTREQTRIAFGTLLNGDEVAQEFLNSLVDFGATTPFEFDQLTTMSKTLLAYGYKMEEIVPLLTKVGDGGSALGMGAEDINIVATMLGRMNATNKTTLEYLNPLIERGVPVWSFLSEAMGVTSEKAQEMVSKGLVPGVEAAEMIADYMGATYEGNMEKQSDTFLGLTSSLEDVQSEMDQAMGDAYNEKRKEGLQAQIDYLSGDAGEKMKEANAMIGEWKATLENEHEQAIRDAMDAMMASEEYKKAELEQDKVKMGELLAQAQVQGENEYKAGAAYQEQLASDLELIGKIRSDTSLNEAYYNTGLKMGNEFSKGLAAAKAQISTESFTPSTNTPSYAASYSGTSHAYGLTRVPYDGYQAILHEGERVLTASEARATDNTNSRVIVTGNTFNVREEADINKIARALASELGFASENLV